MKMLFAYNICWINSNALQDTFIMKANTMNPYQTAPNGKEQLNRVNIFVYNKGHKSTQAMQLS